MPDSQETRAANAATLPLEKQIPTGWEGCGSGHVVLEHREEGAGWSTSPARVKFGQCDNINMAKYVWEEPAFLGLYSS